MTNTIKWMSVALVVMTLDGGGDLPECRRSRIRCRSS